MEARTPRRPFSDLVPSAPDPPIFPVPFPPPPSCPEATFRQGVEVIIYCGEGRAGPTGLSVGVGRPGATREPPLIKG